MRRFLGLAEVWELSLGLERGRTRCRRISYGFNEGSNDHLRSIFENEFQHSYEKMEQTSKIGREIVPMVSCVELTSLAEINISKILETLLISAQFSMHISQDLVISFIRTSCTIEK